MKKMALNKTNLVIIIFLELAGDFSLEKLWVPLAENSTVRDPYCVSGSFGDY